MRSFADGDGDGIGDLAGARAHLPYLAELGIDAIWFNPWYPSPMADAGYDISDYRSIEPVFGTLADADALIGEAHALGIKIIIDVVPNHGSDRHPWFAAALAAGPGSAERERFWFRPGRGPSGELPPNNWQSIFGGPAWTRVTEPDGTRASGTCTCSRPSSRTSTGAARTSGAEFEDVLRFWFDRGVDGIRIDSAALLTKDPALPDVTGTEPPGPAHPYTDRDDVHEIYRSWRAIADEAPGRMLIGEVWLPDAARLARYVGPGELHTVFNFPYLNCPWDAAALRQVIEQTLALNGQRRPATWVLSNHDVDRLVSRLRPRRHLVRPGPAAVLPRPPRRPGARHPPGPGGGAAHDGAARLGLHLPGRGTGPVGGPGHPRRAAPGPDLGAHRRRRPRPGRLPGAAALVRDGAAVRLLPRRAAREPWLPQPKEWRDLTVAAESANPDSMLRLYREALRIRRSEPAFGETALTWRQAPDGVLAFDRGPGSRARRCAASPTCRGARRAAAGRPVLLASGPLADGQLPPDTTAWLRVAE